MSDWENGKKRILYAALFIVLFCLEGYIAVAVHDKFVRPYIGDALVVVLIYCLARVFLPGGMKRLPLYVFLFAAAVEALQYFNLPGLLGLGDNKVAVIVLGATFDWKDILCYGAGCLAVAAVERRFGQ